MTEVAVPRTGALAVILTALLLALMLAACGTVPAGPGAAASPRTSPAPTFWGSYGPGGTQLVSVRVSGSGRVLSVAAQVTAGRPGCERDLAGTVMDFTAATAYLDVTFQSRLSSVAGACSTRVMTVSVSLPAPLGRRTVVINADITDVFAPSSGALLRRCGLYGCGPFKAAPPGSCAATSFQQAMLSVRPPASAAYWMLGCDSRWLVLDVGWPAPPPPKQRRPGAPVCPPTCASYMVFTRWFYRSTPRGWETIATARTGGCAEVQKTQPQFPTSLCARLPALSPLPKPTAGA
jgi:hypothetical protein